MGSRPAESVSQNYQCPNCSGILDLVDDGYALECRSCGSRFDVKELADEDGREAGKDATDVDAPFVSRKTGFDPVKNYLSRFDTLGEPDDVVAMTCSSCGARYIIRKEEATAECAYCGNHMVSDQVEKAGTVPDLIIPFASSAADALAAVQGNFKQLKLPHEVASALKEDDFKPVFAPIWLYSGSADFALEEIAVHYEANSTTPKRSCSLLPSG